MRKEKAFVFLLFFPASEKKVAVPARTDGQGTRRFEKPHGGYRSAQPVQGQSAEQEANRRHHGRGGNETDQAIEGKRGKDGSRDVKAEGTAVANTVTQADDGQGDEETRNAKVSR